MFTILKATQLVDFTENISKHHKRFCQTRTWATIDKCTMRFKAGLRQTTVVDEHKSKLLPDYFWLFWT